MFRNRLRVSAALGGLATALVLAVISPAHAGGHHQQTVVYTYPMAVSPAPMPSAAPPTPVGGVMVPYLVQGGAYVKHHHAVGSTIAYGFVPTAAGVAAPAPVGYGSSVPVGYGSTAPVGYGSSPGYYYYYPSAVAPSGPASVGGSAPTAVGSGILAELRKLASNPRFRQLDACLGSNGDMSRTQWLRDHLKGALGDLVSRKGGILPSQDVIENALLVVAKDFLSTYGLGWVVDVFKPTILELIGDVTTEKAGLIAQTPATTTTAPATTAPATTTTVPTTNPVTVTPAVGPAGTYQFLVTIQAYPSSPTAPATTTTTTTPAAPVPAAPANTPQGFPNVPADPRGAAPATD